MTRPADEETIIETLSRRYNMNPLTIRDMITIKLYQETPFNLIEKSIETIIKTEIALSKNEPGPDRRLKPSGPCLS
jgi:hypothetical protein